MQKGRQWRVIALLFVLFSCFAFGANAAEKCRVFKLGTNPVDKDCHERVADIMKPGECMGTLTRDVGPLGLCGGNGKYGTGCLGEGEEIVFDPNGAAGCAELLFAVECCNPPETTFCLPAGSYSTIFCKPTPVPEIPPAELLKQEPQEATSTSPSAPPSIIAYNPPEAPHATKCGPACRTFTALGVMAALYGICEWKDIGPCRDGGENDRHKKRCKSDRDEDGDCHQCSSEHSGDHGDSDCDDDDDEDEDDAMVAPHFNLNINASRTGSPEVRVMWNVPLFGTKQSQ